MKNQNDKETVATAETNAPETTATEPTVETTENVAESVETTENQETAEPEVEVLPTAQEMLALTAKFNAAEEVAKTAKEQLLRTAAEYENFRKRSQREAEQKFNDGIGFAISQILPILDTLEMAESAPCTDENYKKGVTMTLGKSAKALEALRINEIDALGKPFDPNSMNAISQVPAPEGMNSGDVVTVYQKGYEVQGKIIRHAVVVVAE